MARLIVEKNIEIPMRDGCILKGDLYRPDTPERLPVLLNRTPYDKSFPPITLSTLDAMRAAQAGYNVVTQDCRGRFASQGTFTCFVDEARDGHDTVEFIAKQPWANGTVGMYGASYMGATQWLAATAQPPSLKAIVPSITASDYHDGWTYQGGALELFFGVSWLMISLALGRLMREREENPDAAKELAELMGSIDTMRSRMDFLPLKQFPMFRTGAPYFFEWLEHPNYDQYWRALCIEESHSKIAIPALNVAGWHDIFMGGSIRNFTGMRARGASDIARTGQRLLAGPWSHAVPFSSLVGQVDYGLRSSPVSIDFDGIQLRFFDRWLKGIDNGLDREAPVRLFVMGANEWRDAADWPLPGTEFRRYYMHSRGNANSAFGDGALATDQPGIEPPDTYLYNPLNPVPTAGGGLCCYANSLPGGAFDQAGVEHRSDVLVYSTEPLAEDLEVIGPVTVNLFASSSAPDTDFTAKLVDVGPCGFARNLTDGIIRARVRDSQSAPKLMDPGKVYEFKIDLWATANVFKAGHRVRLEISSSNFPRFDRNPNTGHDLFADAETQPAMQTVMHDRSCASFVTLPVIPNQKHH